MNEQNKYQHGFGIIEIVIVVFVVGLLGALGWVAYNSSQKDKDVSSDTPAAVAENKDACLDVGSIAATAGIFCSDGVGIKFAVPTIFKDKLAKTDNYEVFQGPLDQTPGVNAGTANVVYKAEIAGNDNFTLSVAKEPLRSGYIGVSYLLQNTYFDKDSGVLSQVTEPTRAYDSKTGVSTVVGEYKLGQPVPSVTIDGARFYKASVGDAGTRRSTYMAVINDSIVKIELDHGAYMGDPANDPSTIDADVVFSEFESAVAKLQVL